MAAFGARLAAAWSGFRTGMALDRGRVEPAFDAAGTGARVSQWVGTTAGINSLIGGSGELLRARSRHMRRNNAWTRRATNALVAYWIGTGMTPKSGHPDRAVREELELLFRDWARCGDYARRTTFAGLQTGAARSMVVAGEALARFRVLPADAAAALGLPVPLQLQLLASDQLPFSETRPLSGGRWIVNGVEVDANGRAVAYWLYPDHPGESYAAGKGLDLARLPAGEILHLHDAAEEPGQLRGVPRGASALLPARELHDYRDAERVRKKVAALFALFVKRGRGSGPRLLDGGAAAPAALSGVDATGTREMRLEPGVIQLLDEGDEIQTAAPADVGGSFETFTRHELMEIAAGYGVPESKVSGDLSRANFSSLRAGDSDMQREAGPVQQQVIAPQFCQPVWDRVLAEAALNNALDRYVPDGVSRYLADPVAMRRVNWMAQGWRYVDPLKEASADVIAIRSGIKSRAQVVAERGADVENVDRQIAADNARADALGLVLDSDPRAVNRGGAIQATAVADAAAEDQARESASA